MLLTADRSVTPFADRPLNAREVEVLGVGPRGHWCLMVPEARAVRSVDLIPA